MKQMDDMIAKMTDAAKGLLPRTIRRLTFRRLMTWPRTKDGPDSEIGAGGSTHPFWAFVELYGLYDTCTTRVRYDRCTVLRYDTGVFRRKRLANARSHILPC